VVIIQCIIPEVNGQKCVAIVVHESVVRSVVEKIVCNDRIIALQLKAEPGSILIMQVHRPTSEYEDDEMENCMTHFIFMGPCIVRYQGGIYGQHIQSPQRAQNRGVQTLH
jgi:hypothetical protein